MFSAAVLPAILGQEYALAILRGQGLYRSFNLLRVLPLALYAVGALLCFVSGVDSLETVAVVWVSAQSTASTLAIFTAYREARHGGHEDEAGVDLAGMIRFGLASAVGSASPTETFRIDQAVVGFLLTPAALGVYVVALAFTNLPRFFAQSLGFVIYPELAARESYADARRAMWRYVGASTALCVVTIALLALSVSTLLPFFFGGEFKRAVGVSQLLLVGTVFFCARRLLTEATRGLGHPSLGTFAELSAWILLPGALAVLLPRWGVEGVAVALAVSSAGSLLVLVGLTMVASEASATRPSARSASAIGP